MRTLYPFLTAIVVVICLLPRAARAQDATPTPAPQPVIDSPLPGQAVQGSAAITGSTFVEGFASAELTFGYVDDPTGTWFFIEQMQAPVQAGVLATWDTTILTDGNYNLRLVVTRQDGSQVELIVPEIRVRNYTPIETSTPTLPVPTQTSPPGATPVPSATPTATATPVPPTPTALPANPAVVTGDDLTYNLLRGGLVALAVFATFGLVFALARYVRRR
jgi:hypothetical protein